MSDFDEGKDIWPVFDHSQQLTVDEMWDHS